MHYQALASKRQRDIRNKALINIVCNQLKSALTIIKTKSASLHYEHIIALLSSCGSSVGNLGHGRKQVNSMLKAFQTYIYKKIAEILSTPLLSTGLPPHFCTTSDKSTPLRISNHAIMILVMVNGEKTAIPVSAPHVYEFSESQISGGTAPHLAEQVISSLLTNLNLQETHLSYLVAHQADGQYQAHKCIDTLRERVCTGGLKPANQDDFVCAMGHSPLA